MFAKKKATIKPPSVLAGPNLVLDSGMPESLLKYERPKIVAIDLIQEAQEALRVSGFNVATGSFGTPYKVTVSDGFAPVIMNGEVPPNITEQEIVIVDLHTNEYLPGSVGEKATSPGTDDWFVSCSQGVVDPRPRMMVLLQEVFDKIYRYGGVFIIDLLHKCHFGLPKL